VYIVGGDPFVLKCFCGGSCAFCTLTTLLTMPLSFFLRGGGSYVFMSANLCDIYHLLCLQCKTPDDGQRNCPKHVEFYSKNEFEKIGASSWFYYKNLYKRRLHNL